MSALMDEVIKRWTARRNAALVLEIIQGKTTVAEAVPKVDARSAAPIKSMIEENPSFGYRTVAHLLDFNKNTAQRIFQLKGWQVKKRPVGFRQRVTALPSVAQAPNERWATDLCRIWAGRDHWTTLALAMPGNCLAGSFRVRARPRRRNRPWSRP